MIITDAVPACCNAQRSDPMSLRITACQALLVLGLCLSAAFPLVAQESPAAVPVDHVERVKEGTALFKSDVRAILSTHCLDCHGGQSIKADFDLSTREALVLSGYLADTAADSYLMELITHAQEPHMPLQADRLPQESIELVRRWIDLGAPYDQPLAEGKPDGEPKAFAITDHHRAFWSFQPLNPVPIPTVRDNQWCRTPIDRFILSKQEAVSIAPNPPADARTLLRRATFDLLGLPATAEEVEAFAANDHPSAWSDVLDRLLGAEHYGQRWARHWMDVARFAESHGYEQDYNRPHAYHYRDFLIQAFNRDMPFDQFLQWQLAGDELAPEDPLALMATGFLGAGPFPTQLTEAEFESARYDELDDMVTTTGVAFLGLSVGCARCHDHKFDPIPASDYYRMAANFTTAIRSEIELELDPERTRQQQAQWEADLARIQQKRAEFESQQLPTQFADWIAHYTPEESASPWRTLEVVEIQSSGGSKFEPQGDGSWLAIGPAPRQDVLTIKARSVHPAASKLRLEALTHPSLPHQGPGRANNGNFALGDLQVSVGPAAAHAAAENRPAGRHVSLRHAVATHQQNADSLSVLAAIDADPVSSGWAVDFGGIGQDQAAVFEFQETLQFEGPSQWTMQLTFNHPNPRHAIGRFRVAISDQEAAPIVVGSDPIDPQIHTALVEAKSSGDPDSAAWQKAQAWFATTLPEWQALNRQLRELESAGPPRNLTKVMVTSEGLPPISHHADGRGFPHFYPETYYLNRGDVSQKKEVVTAGFLQVLTPADVSPAKWQTGHTDEHSRTSRRRTALANWMTDTQRGAGHLVARVIVNRVWQHHFGRGLVATPNDFGVSGDRPSHPELLDWLAHDLIQHDWQLKRLHRLIMSSSVYLQSAAYDEPRATIDPENMRLWRWTPRRLEAEAIRDSMLAVSGKLDPTMYGPGTLDPNMPRRSIYFFIKRSQLIPMMMLFDWPEHLGSIGQRSSTTIAPQALMFLNSQPGRQYAQALATRLSQESPELNVVEGYRRVLARGPTEREMALATNFLETQATHYREQNLADPSLAALTDLCQALISMNEFVYLP